MHAGVTGEERPPLSTLSCAYKCLSSTAHAWADIDRDLHDCPCETYACWRHWRGKASTLDIVLCIQVPLLTAHALADIGRDLHDCPCETYACWRHWRGKASTVDIILWIQVPLLNGPRMGRH